MTRETETPPDLTIPPALAAQLQAAAADQHRPAREVLRDAVEEYLRAWRPLTPSQRSPGEAATRMMRARQGNVRLDDAVFVMLTEQRELDPHADLREEVLRRSCQAALDDPRPRIDEVKARLQRLVETPRVEAAVWRKNEQ
jgi:hypothetical protein